MSRSCGDIRTELIDCVRESQCMKTGLRDFHKCMKSPDELDKDCVVLRQGYGDCRRGWMDTRQRMSGNQPGKTESTVQQERLDQVAGKRKEDKSWY